MWDFIVLGLVPGTSLQLAFDDVIRLSAILVLLIILGWELRHVIKPRKFLQSLRFNRKNTLSVEL